MKKYSFYGFIAGQIVFILLIEFVFFPSNLRTTLTEHLILAGALYLITAATFFISGKVIKINQQYFILTVIGATTVKLILYIALIAAILYFFDSYPLPYIFFFFVGYLLVTTTEIIYLVKTLRNYTNKSA